MNFVLHKTKKSLFSCLFFLLFVLGVGLRLYLVFLRDIYPDELLYFNVSLTESFQSIFHIDHHIKDHGMLYFVFLKSLTLLFDDIIRLRLINLVFYVISYLFLCKIFLQVSGRKTTLLVLFLFATNRYFIYLNSLILPYNLTLALTLASIYFLLRALTTQHWRGSERLLFILFTSLATISDYSFFYFFVFYISIFFFCSIKLKLTVLKEYLAVLLLSIIPLVQFIYNWNEITQLFEIPGGVTKASNFLFFLNYIGKDLVFAKIENVGLILLLIILIFSLKASHYYYKKARPKTIFIIAIILNFIFVLLLIFFLQEKISLIISRSFWFFHLMLVIILGLILHRTHHMTGYVLIYLVIPLVIIFNVLNLTQIEEGSYVPPHDIYSELKTKKLLSEIERRGDVEKTVLVYDKFFPHIVLFDYYLKWLNRNHVHNISDHSVSLTKNNYVLVKDYNILKKKIKECTIQTTRCLLVLYEWDKDKVVDMSKDLNVDSKNIFLLKSKTAITHEFYNLDSE